MNYLKIMEVDTTKMGSGVYMHRFKGETGPTGAQGYVGTQGAAGAVQFSIPEGSTGTYLKYDGSNFVSVSTAIPTYATQELAKTALTKGNVFKILGEDILRVRMGDDFYETTAQHGGLLLRIVTESANETVTVTLVSGSITNYWGDGTVNSSLSHTYSTAGEYLLEISGTGEIRVRDQTALAEILAWPTTAAIEFNGQAFHSCPNLTALNVTGTPVINYGADFFASCPSLTTVNNIGTWDVSGAGRLQGFFFNCTSFDQSIGDWDVTNNTHLSHIMTNVTLSTANYDDILYKWANQVGQKTNQSPNFGFSKYSDSVSHDYLVNTLGWTILDGGFAGYSGTPPISYYPIDTQNASIQDEAGTRHSSANTATFVTGKLGPNALNYDGTGETTTFSDVGLPVGDAARSVSFWVKMNARQTTGVNFVGYGPNGTPFTFLVGILQGGSDVLRLAAWTNTFNSTHTLSTADVGVWRHVVVSYGGSGAITIYKDGVPSSGTMSGGAINTTLTGSLLFNRFSGGGHIDCALDEVAIFDYALTQTQVNEIYNSGNGLSLI